MPHESPTSSEEMAQSFSDCSAGSESESSREELLPVLRPSSGRLEPSADADSLLVCLVIPDLQQSKSMRFKADATVWVAKQEILCTLTQSLRDVLNYGLFRPAVDGRESGFLDEERLLRDHALPTNKGIPTLEFRYKSRVYQQPNVDEKQITKLHTQANLRKFTDYIQQHHLDKVSKFLEKGLDPNYHDAESGETPLTLAAHLDNMVEIITALKHGGAHLDFRARDGMTALHKAVQSKNQITLKALLELGASPDYKDSQSLTPLYHTVLVGGDPSCCELLLRARASVSCHDENGWHEVHQACRYGHVQHLEHLLFYGADMSVQNASGNTALHICALYKQENCARVLLVRGANKEVKNQRGQTSFQVAIIAGNFELAEYIKNHKEADIVPFREAPSPSACATTSRRAAVRSTLSAPRVLLRSNSDNNLHVQLSQQQQQHPRHPRSRSPSPSLASPLRSLSPRRLAQQMQSSPNGTVKTMGRGAHAARSRSPSLGRLAAGDARRPQQNPPRKTSPRPSRDGLSSAETPGSKRKMYSAVPGRHYVVVKSYQPQSEGEITLYKNDRVKVLSVGEGGYWEGSARGNVGWFPAECVEEIPNKATEDRPYSRADRSERRKLFRHYTVGSYDSFDASSDCVIDEKTVVLQKKDNEGFGFVLRGAKADTPIEEFTPTPAFPALQYLESVDEGGVAWQAGLRTGDFLIEVNQENVVKVGHKQVVNMIRHGTNHLIIKVVTVSRNLDPDDTARKKVPPPPRRAPSTALSMRSKSMTSELEDMDKVDEIIPTQKPPWDNSTMDTRVAAVKPRPTSRCFAVAPEMNSLCNSQDVAVDSPPVPGSPRAGYLDVPRATMRRQTSIGVTEEEKQFLTPPVLKFTRSLSMPDTSEDIPPPPAISPPSPPYNGGNNPPTPNRVYGTIRAGFGKGPASNSTAPERGDVWREQGPFYRDSPEHFQTGDFNHSGPTAQQSLVMRRALVPENPYSDMGKHHASLFAPNKPMRRKGMLVKQPNVEDSPEKTTISIPTIIIKEPSTSSSGKSSQGSSMEIETGSQEHPGQLRPDDLGPSNPFATAMVHRREKRLEIHRNAPSFRSTDLADDNDSPSPSPAPRLRHSKSIDEGMFSSDERLRRLMAPPASLLSIPQRGGGSGGGGSGGGGGGGGNVTDFNSPEPTVVREVLNTRTGHHSPISLPANKTYNVGGGNYVHPVTGKPLDPNSPLALALAARDRAMREQSQPLPLKSELAKADLNKPLFIDTKLRSNVAVSFSATATMGRPGRSALRRQMTEAKYETESKYSMQDGLHLSSKEEKRPEEKKNMLVDIVDTSQHKSAGLLMVHTSDGTKKDGGSLSDGEREEGSSDSVPGELRDPNQPALPANPGMGKSLSANAAHGKTIITISSVDEPVKLPFGIPPPPLASVDIDEEFPFTDPLPPPLEFANSFDIPEDQRGLAQLLKQKANGTRGSSLTPFYSQLSAEVKRPAVLTNCTPPSFPPMDAYEPITDSGIEVDSRSSGDPQLETTSTVSTVSSISTLSSEGGEPLDTCTVYADGQAFLVDRPPAAMSKPKLKPILNKNALYKEEESMSSFRVPSSIPPPPSNPAPPEPPKTPTQRSSKLWGDPGDLKSPHAADLNAGLQHASKDKAPKPGEPLDSPTGARTHFESRNPDGLSLVSGTQQNTTVTFSPQPGPNVPPNATATPPSSLPPSHHHHHHGGHHGLPHHLHHGSSPIMSPPDSGLGCTTSSSSSLPPSASSPTMTDVFGLPTPPLSLGTGRSRSPSPLTLIQAPSNKPFATKPVVMWTKHDVADWLESLNLGEHRDAFMENDIEGSHLPNLQKDDLIDLGVTRVGHRMNIERALKVLLDR
ncbi:SH3 and multiple ankyrin repeat domains protein 2b [Sardina pilchardus]|uniref:SH3 and multiple ankyrin repeat domains protein 2b n=1 Tax=Sardina pilchardus TaxID=27697 RepID=UPI002E0E7FA0